MTFNSDGMFRGWAALRRAQTQTKEQQETVVHVNSNRVYERVGQVGIWQNMVDVALPMPATAVSPVGVDPSTYGLNDVKYLVRTISLYECMLLLWIYVLYVAYSIYVYNCSLNYIYIIFIISFKSYCCYYYYCYYCLVHHCTCQ